MNESLLDPNTIAKIDNFYLLARTVVEGFISGLHKSLYHGFGSEFVHYRNYSQGDDLKYIDWKVYARLGKLQIKVFQEETNTNCYIILDSSASMNYPKEKNRLSKFEYGKMLAACLSYLVNRQGDNVGFYAYDETIRSSLKPGHRSGQVQNICNILHQLKPHGLGNHSSILGRFAELFNRRGVIVIISDFLDLDDSLMKAIRYFRVSHQDCILFQILDSDELEFPFQEDVRFVDSETGIELGTAPEVVRGRYLNSLNKYLSEFEDFCFKNNLDYNQISTNQPMASNLVAYLHKRYVFR